MALQSFNPSKRYVDEMCVVVRLGLSVRVFVVCVLAKWRTTLAAICLGGVRMCDYVIEALTMN